MNDIDANITTLRNGKPGDTDTVATALEFWRQALSLRPPRLRMSMDELKERARRKPVSPTPAELEERQFRKKLTALEVQCETILKHFCMSRGLHVPSFELTEAGGVSTCMTIKRDLRRQWEHDADLIELELRAVADDTEPFDRLSKSHQHRPVAVNSKGKATINARMIDALGKQHDAAGWTCKQWSQHLHCSQAAIVKTNVWKSMRMEKEKGKAEHASKKAAEKRRR